MTDPILIVDDEPSNLATLRQILMDEYPLVFARNGSEGLAAAKKHCPALILLDIQMPDMDGYRVCRMLKADPLTENIPVIFISSLSDIGDETAGFASGGVDYIIKPVSPALVHARVRTHLSLVRASTLERYIEQLEIERAKTARLSRIHAVLSGTNAAILRMREPQALIEAACRIAVDQGSFGLAWIGLVGESGQIQPVASQGIDPTALPVSRLMGEPLRDIPDQVLLTGKAVVHNDVRLAPQVATCRDAETRGYLSVVGLPFTAGEKTPGVMVLYAREAQFFDDEELKLLGELAGDISFALRALENEKQANFLAYYDVLTGLPNTTLFLDRLNQLVHTARHEGHAAFVIALNLDRFKQLNDALGRHIGDQVLRTIAQRLSSGLSSPCSVARVGADLFAVAGELANNEEVSRLRDQILVLVNDAMDIDNLHLLVTARLGIAIYPTDAADAESLFKNAEAAVKQSKAIKARYLYYSSEINARIAEKIEMEHQLQCALDRDEFVLHFQPKIDLATGRISGAEALIRWQHPELGMVPPLHFIPLAEEIGLIVPIGEWVIRSVCAQQAAWQHSFAPVPVALNLSALQFREGGLLQTVCDSLSAHTVQPAWLELELTETVIMQNPEEAEKTLQAFRQLGLSLSLDDFGTGYSSLAYLKRFPFDTVKIDRAFITDITRNPEDAAIALAIIAMAHSLRMRVVAEGVETIEQLDFLRARRCDQMQGYYFSRPVPAAEFAAMIAMGKCLELPR